MIGTEVVIDVGVRNWLRHRGRCSNHRVSGVRVNDVAPVTRLRFRVDRLDIQPRRFALNHPLRG